MRCVVYRTINLANDKIYVGVHCARVLDENYLGSGRQIEAAVRKYGRRSFRRDILFEYSTVEEAHAKEREIVTEEFCKRTDTYNINVGGKGGWAYVNKNGRALHWSASQESKSLVIAKLSVAGRRYRHTKGRKWMRRGNEERNVALSSTESYLQDGWTFGRSTTTPSMRGRANPQYGRRWISKDGASMKVRPEDATEYLEIGWRYGRVVTRS